MTILGENIKKLRERAGMTIKELSTMANVGQSTISEIETGKAKNPKSATLTKLAKVLNTSVDNLTEMELEHEYIITDVEEAINLILNQEKLMLHGELLGDEAKNQLKNGMKMALNFTEEVQSKNK